MKKGFLQLFILAILPALIPCAILAQSAADVAANVGDAVGLGSYLPYILAALLAISEILALSPIKSNGIVALIINIIKAIAGKK